MKETQTDIQGKARRASAIWLLAVLFVALSILCYQAFQPHMTMWQNDTHLGGLEASSMQMPQILYGEWVDFWWISFEAPAAPPSFSMFLLLTCERVLPTLLSHPFYTLGTLLVLGYLVSLRLTKLKSRLWGRVLWCLGPALCFLIYEFLVGQHRSEELFQAIYTPFTMLLLGFSAWLLFFQLKFAPWVCVLGALAAGLNMHCFSNGCWGTGTWNISIAMCFLAVAAIVTDKIRQIWIKASLAGLATGMAVMEGFDSGAILSVFLGIFAAFVYWITETTWAARLSKSIGTGALMVLFAGWIAASTISTLTATQIQGIAQPGDTPEKVFDNATIWSLPKLESLRVIIPGLFGYRIAQYTTPPPKALAFLLPSGDHGEPSPTAIDLSPAYWGGVGEDPHITRLESRNPEVRAATAASLGLSQEVIDAMRSDDKEAHTQILDAIKGQLQIRFSGNGEYAGILVALFAIFAVVSSLRATSSPYNTQERFLVWFWGLAALFSLVAAWGRFAPLYHLLFHLPMMDKIRNPIKFMHPFTLAWIILSGFGLEAFSRCYLRTPAKESAAGKILDSKSWWEKLSGFDKKYLIGLLSALVLCAVAWLVYAGFKPDLAQYLTHQGFDAGTAARIATFSVRDALWFVLILAVSGAVILGALVGFWAGARSVWFWGLLCFIMVFDLGRADVPWLRYFDASKTYSMNDITQFLMDKPYEHRVVGRLAPNSYYDLPVNDQDFAAAIHWWLENDFPAHDIQSLEIDQAPRSPVLDNNYLGYLGPRDSDSASRFSPSRLSAAARLWKLTNTRYIFAASDLLPLLNQYAVPGRQPFRFAKRFNLVAKPGVAAKLDAGDITPQFTDQGADALIEYTEALPRAKLYSRWLVPPDDNATLQVLANPQWDPDQYLLLSKPTNGAALPPSSQDPNADAGSVEITHYAAKQIELQAKAKTPAILLYNDRIAPGWHAWVDGKPAELLRCNYIMRGVFLPAGEHSVEFKFAPSLLPLCITLAAEFIGFVLLVYVGLSCCRKFAAGTPA